MATRAQVLAAYAANPKAELFPSEAAIQYWQGAGLGSFDATVDAVRAENPALAAQIDAQRTAVSTNTGATTGAATGADTGATTGAATGANTGLLDAVAATNTAGALGGNTGVVNTNLLDAVVSGNTAATGNTGVTTTANTAATDATDDGGYSDAQVIVYGPDGTMYSSPGDARAAGVTNYTTTRPATTGATTGAATGATRQQVLEAYRNNPLAETNPSEESIQYWMANGLGSFNSTVDAVRAANPDFATAIDAIRNQQMVTDAYGDIGRTGVGTGANQIDQAGLDYWTNELNSGRISQSEFDRVFSGSVADYLRSNPADDVTQRVAQYRPFANPGIVQTQPVSRGAPAVPGYQSPGLNANLASYLGLPIGAQYNPNVTAGGASPYSQIMAQTPGFINPYADVVSGVPMGGYNPNIYNANLLSNFQRQRADDAAAETIAAIAARNAANLSGQDGDAVGGDDGDDGTGNAAAAAAAGTPGSSAGAAGGQGGTGIGEGGGTGMGGYYQGGLINQVGGADPAGPDEGQINVQKGEYVIKKSSAKKYGKGLLDMINDGKIPAKKIRSLLD